jgi:hypothetical protein
VPSVYEATCPHCGHWSGATSAGYLALRLDGDVFKILRHPGETFDLESAGYTWERAEKENRLVRIEVMLCDDCGQQNQKYVALSHESCLFILVAGIVILLACLFGVPASYSYSWREKLEAAWAFFCLFVMFYSLYASHAPRRRRVQATLPRLTQCQRCGGRRFHALEAFRVGACPQCGVRGFRYVSTGVS